MCVEMSAASMKLFWQCNNTQNEKEWFRCMAEVDMIVSNLLPAEFTSDRLIPRTKGQ